MILINQKHRRDGQSCFPAGLDIAMDCTKGCPVDVLSLSLSPPVAIDRVLKIIYLSASFSGHSPPTPPLPLPAPLSVPLIFPWLPFFTVLLTLLLFLFFFRAAVLSFTGIVTYTAFTHKGLNITYGPGYFLNCIGIGVSFVGIMLTGTHDTRLRGC